MSKRQAFVSDGGTHVGLVVHAVHMIDNKGRDETHTPVELEELNLSWSVVEDTRRCSCCGLQ